MTCQYDQLLPGAARSVRFRSVLPASMCLLVLGAVAVAATAPQPLGKGARRTVLLVQLPAAPSWRDMAFLAAVPAGTAANDGRPAVIGVDASGAVGRETEDYLRRYKPALTYAVGGGIAKPAKLTGAWRELAAGSADAAACGLAGTFWTACPTVVICPADDYAAALVAAPLAARLRSPLLFGGEAGVSADALKELKRLGASKAVVVGPAAKAAAALKARGIAVTALADANAVLVWMKSHSLPVTYLAAVNPTDRSLHRMILKAFAKSLWKLALQSQAAATPRLFAA